MNSEIVIVDDDVIGNRILAGSFKNIGYKNIVCFNEGNKFLKYLFSSDTILPKIVIMDYNMPSLTGFQIMAYLKQNNLLSQIKVIIYSAFEDEDIKRTCLKAGAWDFVKKKEDLINLKKFCAEVLKLTKTENSKAN